MCKTNCLVIVNVNATCVSVCMSLFLFISRTMRREMQRGLRETYFDLKQATSNHSVKNFNLDTYVFCFLSLFLFRLVSGPEPFFYFYFSYFFVSNFMQIFNWQAR